MIKRLYKSLTQSSYKNLLVTTYVVGIILLIAIATLITSNLSSKSVHDSLSKTGLQLIASFAHNSRIALLYLSEDEATIAVTSILSFPDVVNAGIYNNQMKPLYQSTEGINKNIPKQQNNSAILEHESESEWIYSSPVFSTPDNEIFLYSTDTFEPQLLGYVRLTISKNVLVALKSDFYKYNLIVIGILALLLLWALLIVTKRITKPIDNLAKNMLDAAKGYSQKRTNMGSTQDIMRMEQAFTDMMHILENREKELLMTRDLALEAAKVKSDFAANVSHELRTPLNGISGMLELLSDMDLNSQQKEYLTVASESADSLLELIDNVLDFSVYDQDNVSLHTESFNLRNVLENLILLLSPQAQLKNISLAYFIADDVPKNLIADILRLQQILQNLLGNAIKFTQAGDVSICVSVDTSHETSIRLLFEVIDTGIGIPIEAQGKIFNAFSQADSSTTRVYGGTGLGLAICRQLVTIFGGEIGLNSVVGEGSTFWFTVNLEINEQPDIQNDVFELPQGINHKILFVSDNQFSSRFMTQHFQTLSYNVDYVENGANAVKKLRYQQKSQNSYDFILIDELNSDISQTSLTQIINADKALSATKIILLISTNFEQLSPAKKLHVFGSITKPVKQSDLISKLNSTKLITTSDSPKSTELDDRPASYKDKKILVVEDNRANQVVAEAMLERFSCNVIIANNGIEALRLIKNQSFDLIFMDCQMPEMDGYEATFQVRQLENIDEHTPIIAMTANKQVGDREKCLAVGMDGFMAKPLKLNILEDTLQTWLSTTSQNIHPIQNMGTKNVLGAVLDENIYLELQRNLGQKLKIVLELFQEDTPAYLAQLKMGIEKHDRTIIKIASHTLKSTASNLGALRLSNACDVMENACENEDTQFLSLQHKMILLEADLVQKEIPSKINLLNSLPTEQAEDHNQTNILLIDYDKDTRLTLRKGLENNGHWVDEVINADQGLMYCERNRPDLVILEHVLTDNHDVEFKKICLRFKDNEIPFVITSAIDTESSISNAFDVGALDYFSKPLNLSLFIHRINRIIAAKKSEKQIFDLAHKDPLTGLMNRSLFTKKASELLTRHEKDGKMMAIIFLDLDRFKLVNDSYGHEAGDLLLKIVAERLSGSVRHVDIVSRFGGDEFVIALTDIKSYEIIEQLAHKIQNNLSRPFVFLEKEMHVNASIGISVFPSSGCTISDLIKNADIAMYASKEAKNPFIFFDQSMEEVINKRLSIENELRNAISRDELKVFYQPQFDISTGDLIGMEALVRWQHPERGLIPPNDFIGISEETGQIHIIGQWVLETACSTLKSWIDRGAKPIRVAVNLSNLQLEDGEIINKISSVLEKTQLPHDLLELEITESSIMHNEQLIISKLDTLKELGIKLAIDDFGTGYSSLSYLKRLPINLLKIDRSFVNNSIDDNSDADIIRTIVILAHSMGIEVIAEGVETKAQNELLHSLHCDYVQGYLFGKPMPANEFEKILFPKVIHDAPSISLIQ
ncbi:MAG: diguanylate cyclase [Cycloclasticus sp.]|nr:MAG: diguanylate cyclase [Cycloclasticus sp.]